MPTKDSQIAQEAVRKLAESIQQQLGADPEAQILIEAELHRALDPLLEAAQEAAKGERAEYGSHAKLLKILEDTWLK